MEIAVGEYEVDFTRMMAAAIKKYYEDRDKYDLEQLQATTESILRASQTGKCDNDNNDNVTVYEFVNKNNNDDVIIKKFKEIQEVKAATGKFRMEKHTENATLLMQFFVLFDRNFKASSRNRVSTCCCAQCAREFSIFTKNISFPRKKKISNSPFLFFQFLIYARIFAHLLIAPIFGYIYINVGSSAINPFGNYVYLYGTILLIVYTGKMSVVMSCEWLLLLLF